MRPTVVLLRIETNSGCRSECLPRFPTHSKRVQPRSPLVRILGLGFGVAVIFGGTVGVGILRLPGTIAGELRSFWLILAIWAAGALYALLGAISLSELGTAMPQAGGFYIYARRAFGPAVGFATGWADWLNNCAVVAYGAVTAAEYLGALFAPLAAWPKAVALGLLALFCVLHLAGLKLSSRIQQFTQFHYSCDVSAAGGGVPPARGAADRRGGGAGLRGIGFWEKLVPMVAALRAIVVTYDGWYEAIYFTEEDTDAARHLPRAMIGGVLIVLALYLVMNLAFLHVLTIPELAGSTLPAADAGPDRLSGVGRAVRYCAFAADVAEPDERGAAGSAPDPGGNRAGRAVHGTGDAGGGRRNTGDRDVAVGWYGGAVGSERALRRDHRYCCHPGRRNVRGELCRGLRAAGA